MMRDMGGKTSERCVWSIISEYSCCFSPWLLTHELWSLVEKDLKQPRLHSLQRRKRWRFAYSERLSDLQGSLDMSSTLEHTRWVLWLRFEGEAGDEFEAEAYTGWESRLARVICNFLLVDLEGEKCRSSTGSPCQFRERSNRSRRALKSRMQYGEGATPIWT